VIFRLAALIAALGTLLVSVAFLVNNIIPIATNLELVAAADAAVVVLTTIVPSLAWTAYFAACMRRGSPHVTPALAWTVLVLAVAVPELYQAWLRLPYFSVFAVNSLLYAVRGILLPIAWGVFLASVARRKPVSRATVLALLLLTVLSAGPESLNSLSALNVAAGEALWRTVAVPAIRLVYWGSQAVFLIAVLAAPAGKPASTQQQSQNQ
jgi:hypothetical protein